MYHIYFLRYNRIISSNSNITLNELFNKALKLLRHIILDFSIKFWTLNSDNISHAVLSEISMKSILYLIISLPWVTCYPWHIDSSFNLQIWNNLKCLKLAVIKLFNFSLYSHFSLSLSLFVELFISKSINRWCC